jgi:hypothetical protein
MDIAMQEVKSSNIKAVGYDDTSKTLAVQFSSGNTYYYSNVPRATFDEFVAAESVGRYFAANIRGGFEGRREDDSAE